MVNKKKSKTKAKSKSKKSKTKKFELKTFHFVYIAVFLIFVVAIYVVPAISEDDNNDDEGMCSGCQDSCDGCGESCGCVDEEDDNNDDNDDNEDDENENIDEANEDNVDAQNAETAADCEEFKNAESTVSGEIFQYTYSVQVCENTLVSVYLKTNDNEKVTLEMPTRISKLTPISGSGERLVTENFRQICVELDGDASCS